MENVKELIDICTKYNTRPGKNNKAKRREIKGLDKRCGEFKDLWSWKDMINLLGLYSMEVF